MVKIVPAYCYKQDDIEKLLSNEGYEKLKSMCVPSQKESYRVGVPVILPFDRMIFAALKTVGIK